MDTLSSLWLPRGSNFLMSLSSYNPLLNNPQIITKFRQVFASRRGWLAVWRRRGLAGEERRRRGILGREWWVEVRRVRKRNREGARVYGKEREEWRKREVRGREGIALNRGQR